MSDTTRKEEKRKRILEVCKLRGWVEADYYYFNSINRFIRFISHLSIVLVGLSPIILYVLKYFFDEDVESIDQIAAVAIPAMKIVAILLLFLLVSHKSLYWVLLIVLVAFGFCNEFIFQNSASAVIACVAYLYALSLLYINNFEKYTSVLEKEMVDYSYRDGNWGIALFPLIIMQLILVLLPFAGSLPSVKELVKPEILSEFLDSWFCILLSICVQCFLYKSITSVIFSRLFSGMSPSRNAKVVFSPINKYFIGGLFLVILGVGLVLTIFHFHDQLYLLSYEVSDV